MSKKNKNWIHNFTGLQELQKELYTE